MNDKICEFSNDSKHSNLYFAWNDEDDEYCCDRDMGHQIDAHSYCFLCSTNNRI